MAILLLYIWFVWTIGVIGLYGCLQAHRRWYREHPWLIEPDSPAGLNRIQVHGAILLWPVSLIGYVILVLLSWAQELVERLLDRLESNR